MTKNTVLISGASAGFGRAIALKLAKDGYKIIAMARREDKLQKLKEEIEFLGAKCLTFCCDVRDKEEIDNFFKNLDEEFKDIEILVNNAGLALGQSSILETSLEDLEIMVDTNIKGVLNLTKAVLPIMKARNSGYIFNLSSVAGTWPYFGGHVYGASKAFITQFSLNLRNDLRGSKIRVTNIEPGIAKTEFSEVRFKGDIAKAEAVYENIAYLHAEDIAQVIFDCINLPQRVNLNRIEIMPTVQTWAGFHFERD